MTYDYFYGQQAEMFAFYRVPKVLFTEDCFWNVSTDAKLLYGILLDRMNLSARNGWLDEEGRVYIIFTIEEIKGALGCAEKKAVKLLDELEKKCGLIERKRQGLGKPNLIYVKNFISGSVERQFLNCQKDNSGVVKNTIQELSKAQGNNTDTNYIDFSDTDPFFPSGFCGKEVDETDEFTRYYQYFYEQLSMDYLKQDYPYDHEILDLILHLIVEIMCSNRKQIRIASDDKPIEIVKSSFMKLDSEHIRFVLSSFKENTTDVRNIKQYLLASIYNAPYTISAHYDAKMDLDIDVARLKVLKADHQSQQYRMEDKLLKYFPAEIEKQTGYIHGFEADIKIVEAHPQISEGFCGMEIMGRHYAEKADAGEIILAACKETKSADPVPLGSYRGFRMELSYDSFRSEFDIVLKGAMSHRVALGTDARGNITRLDNALSGIPERLERANEQLTNLYNQQEAAKAELGKPFPQEAELVAKSQRLAELDAALNMEDTVESRAEKGEAERPSVLADLKSKSEHIPPAKRSEGYEEVL